MRKTGATSSKVRRKRAEKQGRRVKSVSSLRTRGIADEQTHRSEATLAKSFDTLKIKKFDLEFSVDPLFKKTKEDFDEGGAMGLLLNHLGVDGKGRLVFDAGDATVGDEEDELDPRDDEMCDLTDLRSES
jgi:condensin complex subunit 2